MSGWKQIEYPHVLVFLGLYIASVLALGFVPPGAKVTGLLLVFWGFFAVLRVLWLIEALLLARNPDQPGHVRLLPWIILSALERRKRLETAMSSLYTLNTPFLLWLGAAVLVLAGLYWEYRDALALAAEVITILAAWLARSYACNRAYDKILPAGVLAGAVMALLAGFLNPSCGAVWLGLWVCVAVIFTRYEAFALPKRRAGLTYHSKK